MEKMRTYGPMGYMTPLSFVFLIFTFSRCSSVLSTGSAPVSCADCEQVTTAGDAVHIGFNNAYQSVVSADGVWHLVWMDDSRVMQAFQETPQGVFTTDIIASNQASLGQVALATSQDTVMIAWSAADSIYYSVSTNLGQSWSSTQVLESNGTGPSLAADATGLVAVWHSTAEEGIRFASWNVATLSWSSSTRVDSSSADPLWASIEKSGDNLWVVWRDNRSSDGLYRVYLRRSTTNGATWLSEQQITTDISGDPSVCTDGQGDVWVAHHGLGDITAHLSTNSGSSFTKSAVVGQGYFARISCDTQGNMVVSWEKTTGDVQDNTLKHIVYAVGDSSGSISAVTTVADKSISSNIHMRSNGTADLLWIDLSNNINETTGELWHLSIDLF